MKKTYRQFYNRNIPYHNYLFVENNGLDRFSRAKGYPNLFSWTERGIRAYTNSFKLELIYD